MSCKLFTACSPRVLWTIGVVLATSIFFWFMSDRLIYLYSYPKAVDVEVIYTDSVDFPAVTICNQNVFRYLCDDTHCPKTSAPLKWHGQRCSKGTRCPRARVWKGRTVQNNLIQIFNYFQELFSSKVNKIIIYSSQIVLLEPLFIINEHILLR